jgi:hypothetical protein
LLGGKDFATYAIGTDVRFVQLRVAGAFGAFLVLSFCRRHAVAVVVVVRIGALKQQKRGLSNGWLATTMLHKSFLEEFFA